jgi:hypothetical protein
MVKISKHILYPLKGPEELDVDEKKGLIPICGWKVPTRNGTRSLYAPHGNHIAALVDGPKESRAT